MHVIKIPDATIETVIARRGCLRLFESIDLMTPESSAAVMNACDVVDNVNTLSAESKRGRSNDFALFWTPEKRDGMADGSPGSRIACVDA